MLPIQAKPISRSVQFVAAKVAPQVGASQIPCGLCCSACNLVPDPTARAWCKWGCDYIPGCTCP